MEQRIEKLEALAAEASERLTKIETRLEGIELRMATKADLLEAINNQIKWTVGTAVGLGAVGITVMTFVLNNASPRANVSAPPPIIITLPSGQLQPPVTPALSERDARPQK
jgi:uncharacterized coiled-coil protein SlyX